MTKHYTPRKGSAVRCNVTPTGIYCYFVFDKNLKVAKFLITSTKASINAIQYIEPTAVQGHIPSSVDSSAKIQ